ncbi:hypothetical protein TELCIR_11758 [Teladorsagia circumcincta]|uniref:Uncharacterized protein n=1 Tax=Teladorsagia circumcincta TaxID=45464 RepID=A0A2G9U8N4_TELCI|nr:hypothetical protein TELCIR_11758 [Teladorsagia circumcincta]
MVSPKATDYEKKNKSHYHPITASQWTQSTTRTSVFIFGMLVVSIVLAACGSIITPTLKRPVVTGMLKLSIINWSAFKRKDVHVNALEGQEDFLESLQFTFIT